VSAVAHYRAKNDDDCLARIREYVGRLPAVRAVALILGIYTRYAAIIVVVFMAIAAAAVLRVTQGKWLWNLGGCEYPVFWGIVAVVVAMRG